MGYEKSERENSKARSRCDARKPDEDRHSSRPPTISQLLAVPLGSDHQATYRDRPARSRTNSEQNAKYRYFSTNVFGGGPGPRFRAGDNGRCVRREFIASISYCCSRSGGYPGSRRLRCATFCGGADAPATQRFRPRTEFHRNSLLSHLEARPHICGSELGTARPLETRLRQR